MLTEFISKHMLKWKIFLSPCYVESVIMHENVCILNEVHSFTHNISIIDMR